MQEAKINLNAVTDSIANLDVLILDTQINNESARELGPLQYIATLMDRPMDQIINWFMLLIIFVFDPLAIGMVVAANMAFSTLKPKKNNREDEIKEYFVYRNKELEKKVECSLPEGAEWGVSYSLKDNDHFNPADVNELKHWTKKQRTSSMNITSEDEKRMDVIGQNGNDGLHYEEDEIEEEEYIYPLDEELKQRKEEIKNPIIISDPEDETEHIKKILKENKEIINTAATLREENIVKEQIKDSSKNKKEKENKPFYNIYNGRKKP